MRRIQHPKIKRSCRNPVSGNYDREREINLLITFDLLENHVLKQLPSVAYTTRQEDSRNGPVLRIVPWNPRAAQLSVWVGGSGSCDFSFGRAFFRELDLERGEELLELADAVIQGRLIEKIWTFGNHELYSKSSLQLKGHQTVIRNGLWLFYPPWLKHTYTYEPFVTP